MEPRTPIDDYLARVPSAAFRSELERIRGIVRDMVPDAEEVISYGVPTMKRGGAIVHFAAFKSHCSLFAGYTVGDFAEELRGYRTSTGTIRFTPDHPLPEDLVRRIVQARLSCLSRCRASEP